jgi:hypothetical protein
MEATHRMDVATVAEPQEAPPRAAAIRACFECAQACLTCTDACLSDEDLASLFDASASTSIAPTSAWPQAACFPGPP